MTTKKDNPKKTFDAVKFMREQRDRISKQTMHLSPDDVVKYFEDKRKTLSEKEKLEGNALRFNNK